MRRQRMSLRNLPIRICNFVQPHKKRSEMFVEPLGGQNLGLWCRSGCQTTDSNISMLTRYRLAAPVSVKGNFATNKAFISRPALERPSRQITSLRNIASGFGNLDPTNLTVFCTCPSFYEEVAKMTTLHRFPENNFQSTLLSSVHLKLSKTYQQDFGLHLHGVFNYFPRRKEYIVARQ